MRLLLATDAWYPQVNGVVRSSERMMDEAPKQGVEIALITPQDFRSVPLPSYPEIRLALCRPAKVARMIAELAPTHIHIATEGPIGHVVRRLCRRYKLPFTTCYHTRLPEYVRARLPVPVDWTYRLMRRFHKAGNGVLVATDGLADELTDRGFQEIKRWCYGVDTQLFKPDRREDLGLEGPIALYVGRLAVEKSVGGFLGLDLPGSKVVVGDGPARRQLEATYPEATFLGLRTGTDLARIFASADVFVFPSRTDTFGMVLLEALASGVPFAAFPTPGAIEVLGDSGTGVLDEDLGSAARRALGIPRDQCRARAMAFSWESSARQFIAHVEAGNAGQVIDVTPLARHGVIARVRRYWDHRAAVEPTG